MYDVIIIGAGSAGSVLANRLSEDPNRSILLIEAGPDYALASNLPFELVNSHRNAVADHDWGRRGRHLVENWHEHETCHAIGHCVWLCWFNRRNYYAD